MFFIILVYVILFRICLASPGEPDINGELNKNINVPQQINNVGMPDTEVSDNPISDFVSIDPDNYTDINLDRMHDFDNFNLDALADNSQLIEIQFEMPFDGMFRLVMRPNRSLDNNFTKPWVLQFYSDEAELILIKGRGPYHLLTKEDQKKVAHTLKTMIDTHYSDLKWYDIVIVVDTYKCTINLKPKPEAPAHCRTYSKRVPISGHWGRLMFA